MRGQCSLMPLMQANPDPSRAAQREITGCNDGMNGEAAYPKQRFARRVLRGYNVRLSAKLSLPGATKGGERNMGQQDVDQMMVNVGQIVGAGPAQGADSRAAAARISLLEAAVGYSAAGAAAGAAGAARSSPASGPLRDHRRQVLPTRRPTVRNCNEHRSAVAGHAGASSMPRQPATCCCKNAKLPNRVAAETHAGSPGHARHSPAPHLDDKPDHHDGPVHALAQHQAARAGSRGEEHRLQPQRQVCWARQRRQVQQKGARQHLPPPTRLQLLM